MKLIGVIGEPATGKTTLLRYVLQRLGNDYQPFKFGRLLYGRQYKGGLYVLGIYADNETFGGTDRLSMAVQPVAIRFLNKVPTNAVVLFEGDRLTRVGFLGAAGRDRLRLFLVEASPQEKLRRHRARRDTQSVQFHRSRATLIRRISDTFPVDRLRNETTADLRANADRVMRALPVATP